MLPFISGILITLVIVSGLSTIAHFSCVLPVLLLLSLLLLEAVLLMLNIVGAVAAVLAAAVVVVVVAAALLLLLHPSPYPPLPLPGTKIS